MGNNHFTCLVLDVHLFPLRKRVANMTFAQFVMIELNVTLSDTHQVISHSIKLTFDTLLPDSAQ
jgi:hypothetical protein